MIVLPVKDKMAYSDKVLDHYENPRNVGKMEIEKKSAFLLLRE